MDCSRAASKARMYNGLCKSTETELVAAGSLPSRRGVLLRLIAGVVGRWVPVRSRRWRDGGCQLGRPLRAHSGLMTFSCSMTAIGEASFLGDFPPGSAPPPKPVSRNFLIQDLLEGLLAKTSSTHPCPTAVILSCHSRPAHESEKPPFGTNRTTVGGAGSRVEYHWKFPPNGVCCRSSRVWL